MKTGILNKIVSLGLILGLLTSTAFACDPSTDITRQGDTYVYSKDCHIEFGKSRVKVRNYEKQIESYEKIKKSDDKIITNQKKKLEMKDLQIRLDEHRINNYRSTSVSLTKKVNKLEEIRKRNKWIYFGLGVLATGLAVHAAGSLK